MLIVFQTPFADSRDFITANTHQLKKPDWLNINPDLRKDFIHRIGVIEKSKIKKIDWTSADVACRARKLFSFDTEEINALARENPGLAVHSRRLFPTEIREIGRDESGGIITFHNKAIGSMEVGFIHTSRQKLKENPLSVQDLSRIIKKCISLKVNIKPPEEELKTCKLHEIGRYIGKIYLCATTEKAMRNRCPQWWVSSGAPMLVVAYRRSEVTGPLANAEFIKRIENRGMNIYFGRTKVNDGAHIKTWYIETYGGAKQRDVKMLMEGLLHINASQQCLNRIINYYDKIDITRGTPPFDKFNRYLDFTFASLFKRSRFGFPCKEFADVLAECEDAVSQTLRNGIMNKFGQMGVRGNSLKNLDLYISETGGGKRVDVLILTAVEDEFKVIYGLEPEWTPKTDKSGYRYYVREMKNKDGQNITLGLALAADMGEVNITNLATRLSNELKPDCLAMTGICAGWRKKVQLGDVIVANRVFNYDCGKLIAFQNGTVREEQLFHDIRTYNLNPLWKQSAQDMGDEWKDTIITERPLEYAFQELWLLKSIRDFQMKKGIDPTDHPDRKTSCPDWTIVIKRLEEKGLIGFSPDVYLTDAGRDHLKKEEFKYPDGYAAHTDLNVYIAPIGTGSKVVEDSGIFPKISREIRSVLGLEMEGFAVGAVAELEQINNFIVVKAVSDYADEEKDDHFRTYSIEASFRFLIAFLEKNYTVK